MAHKKAGGSSRNGRDSNPKYLGVKVYGNEKVVPGNIIVRQRGSKFNPGYGVGQGRDDTLYALMAGRVKYTIRGPKQRRFVYIEPVEAD